MWERVSKENWKEGKNVANPKKGCLLQGFFFTPSLVGVLGERIITYDRCLISID
jgi:hypothetical protein